MVASDDWNDFRFTPGKNNGGSAQKEPSEEAKRKFFLSTIHRRKYRLVKENYIDIVSGYPDLYDELPDDIKCQEIELASKL
jgi:hypothetical protein